MDNDVLFREGLTLKGEVTYTPRLLSLDLQGSLGLLPQCGELYGRCGISEINYCFQSLDYIIQSYPHYTTSITEQ